MKELFIKCPSCGAVLGVKNSKNETVKKIACPQCKQHLAVSFEEENKPEPTAAQPLGALYYGEMRIPLQEGVNNTQFPGSQCVALNVVRLADGGSKCVVQPLVADGSVKINGEVLQKDDQVVLAKGDRLEIGHVKLCYDKPYSLPVDKPKPENKEPQKPKDPEPPEAPKANHNWLYAVVGLVAFSIVAFLLWPKQKDKAQPEQTADTISIVTPSVEPEKRIIRENARKERQVETGAPDKTTEAPKPTRSAYELEQAALHGDADAQLELGRQLVKRRESHHVILGLNYLRQAAGKGSSEAKQVWHQTVRELQREATTDSAAYYILMRIDQ